MSCQVMYQSYYPYFPYPPHHQPPVLANARPCGGEEAPLSPPEALNQQKTSHSSPSLMSSSSSSQQPQLRDIASSSGSPLGSSPYEQQPYAAHLHQPNIIHSRSPSPRSSSGRKSLLGSPPLIREAHSPSTPSSDVLEEDKSNAGTAQYLSANCVLYTSYIGDASRVVDEHFSRALGEKSKTLPLSQRNLPPSFWNSDYVAASSVSHPHHHSGHFPSSSEAAAAAAYGGDPYANPAFLAAGDSWSNYMSSYHHVHRGMHDMYSASRLNPSQYSSLLLQSTVSSSCSVSNSSSSSSPSARSSASLRKHPDAPHSSSSWASQQNQQLVMDNYNNASSVPHHTHYNPMGGLDGSMQSTTTSKDLYWF